MVEVVFESVRSNSKNHVIVLKERDGSRYLHLWVGEFEAQGLRLPPTGNMHHRPLLYDTMSAMLESLDARVIDVRISSNGSIFHAAIRISTAGREIETDARASDAVNLAVRVEAPIYTDESLLHALPDIVRPLPVDESSNILTPPPPDLGNWLRDHAIPFATTIPGSSFDDLAPIRAIVGDSRIVALGEATHGTREFFQMKHRLVQYLVTEMGFTTLALEGMATEAEALNIYLRNGKGNPASLSASWYQTQEVVDLVKWMRRYNLERGDAPALQFVSLDLPSYHLNPLIESVVTYLERVNPGAATEAKRLYRTFHSNHGDWREYEQATPMDRTRSHTELESIHVNLLRHQDVYEIASSPEAFERALHDAYLLTQEEYAASSQEFYFPVRDRVMAENVSWFLDHASPETKLIIWAHNAHVGTTPWRGIKSMGQYLRERYDTTMRVFGFGFGSGQFRAPDVDVKTGNYGPAVTHTLSLPPPYTFDAAFAQAGLPRMIINFREMGEGGTVSDWLRDTHLMRSIGSGYALEYAEQVLEPIRLGDTFDALIYIATSTASKPTNVRPSYSKEITNLDFHEGKRYWKLIESEPGEFTFTVGKTVKWSGQRSATLQSKGDNSKSYGAVVQRIQSTRFRGRRVCVSAQIKTEAVQDWSGLWIRVDSAEKILLSAPMQDPIKGSTDWTLCNVTLDISEESIGVTFGILLKGTGQVWVANIQFETVRDERGSTPMNRGRWWI